MKADVSRTFYKSIFDNTLDGMAYCQMLFDAQGYPVDFVYLKVNENFGKLTGLQEVVGKKVTELIPDITTSNSELFEIYGRVSLTGKSERFETYSAPLSRWFLISVYSPKKQFFVAVFQNITDQKEIEKDFENAKIAARNVLEDLNVEKTKAEILANELKKFKLALDNTSDQVVITDSEGVVMYANAAVVKITGYTPEEAIGKKSGVLWKSPMPTEYYQNMWHTIKEEKKTFIGEIQNKRKSGELYIAMLTISPVLDTEGNVIFFVGVERDITKEREVDKAKDEFISLASHQMRTPLTAINWYTEMLLHGDAGELNAKQGDYFKEIHAAGQQMNDIIKSFLHILRLE
ncbi:MAG: PAS domain S-box protein, partial [Candidatus Zambryskibacteria bacterium]|nr:PAS domain S-box protein [Candidatus Zambryskibacteria bacterium]